VSRFFTRFVELGLSHNFRYVDFFNISPTLDANRSLLGLDFRDPYLLSYIEVQGSVYLTDRLLEPRHGVVLRVIYDLAGGIFGGQFDYNRVTPELRAYWTPMRRRWQLAGRAQTGFIFPFGDEPGAPFDRQYYLGGANSVRGWGLRRLSPWVSLCPAQDSCERIPIGGQTMVMGNLESRVRVWKGLWVVGFFDMGDVQSEVATFRPTEWNYSAGPGLRYASPIGTFRLDLGVRINKTARFSGEPRTAVHFGLGETF
jgi:outer membrane protein assembly factor BamA